MSKNFRPISFEKFRVGKIMKSSKKRICWKFELDGKEYTLDLFASRISGKRTIFIDGYKVLSTKTSGLGSTYSLSIPKNRIIIYELGDTQYDLRVNNIQFKLGQIEEDFGTLNAPNKGHAKTKSIEDQK